MDNSSKLLTLNLENKEGKKAQKKKSPEKKSSTLKNRQYIEKYFDLKVEINKLLKNLLETKEITGNSKKIYLFLKSLLGIKKPYFQKYF